MDADLVSIATVSEQTGIGIETLRVWERRYGKPEPVRLPSGHRRYTREQIEWLERVADAIACGHRPSKVLGSSEHELDELLGSAGCRPDEEAAVERLIDLARRFAEPELVDALESDARRLGREGLVFRRVIPLLNAVGRKWKAGELGVRHEHFLSEILEDVLRGLRRAAVVETGSPLVLLTTTAGEQHGLGLQCAALLLAAAGVRVRLLGANTPNEEIVEAFRETGATAVALSVSLATGSVETERRIAELRASLPSGARVVAGGQGARRLRRGVRGVDYFPDLHGFRAWLETAPFNSSSKTR